VPTPSLHSDKVRTAPDGFIFGVITNGSGLMPSYKWPIPAEDRWAIVAHLRTLQQERIAESGGAPPAAPAAAPEASPAAATPSPAGGTTP
jgi:hypothetical protein